jgi:acetyl esterase/lipase
MDRRTLLTTGFAAALPVPAFAVDTPIEGDGRVPSDPSETILLWPGTPPGGEGVNLPPWRAHVRTPPALPLADRAIDRVGRPQLDVFRPDRPNGAALLIAPGGGYSNEVFDLEGMDIARHFNAMGVTCFMLRYRLPGEGWARRSDVPLQDAQRAMRLVRGAAAKYAVDPARIGFMGFSAGGHLACSIATRFDAPVYSAVDGADAVSARPDFSVPMYPVVTMGEGAHVGSRDHLLGVNATAQQIDAYSCEQHVHAGTPPTFLCLAADDTVVPPLPNAVAYFTALRGAGIAAELHVFESGGHGFGIANTAGKPTAAWPELLRTFARAHGLFS